MKKLVVIISFAMSFCSQIFIRWFAGTDVPEMFERSDNNAVALVGMILIAILSGGIAFIVHTEIQDSKKEE